MIVFALYPVKNLSQDSQMPSSIGVYAGLNLNMHSPSFNMILNPYFNTSAKFNLNANSYGLNTGGIFNYPLSGKFVLSLRAGYNGLSGSLSGNSQNVAGDSVSIHTFESKLNYIELSPTIQFHNILPLKNLYFLAGIETGIPVSPSYTQTAHYTKPNIPIDIKIANNAALSNASTRIAIAAGLGYVYRLSNTLALAPELGFRFPFNNVSSDYKTWNVPQIRLSLSLLFSLDESGFKGDTVITNSFLDAGFKEVRYFDNQGNSGKLTRIKVDEVQYKEMFPLIPYIFCDEGSEFPSASGQLTMGGAESGEYSISALQANAMTINMHTLNIVGVRMRENPSAEITITGTRDNKGELNADELSAKRAEFAKNYLVVNFGIKPERINSESRALPQFPSSSSVADGIEENRRIEIRSKTRRILEPILVSKDKQSLAMPDLVDFIPYINTSDSISRYEFEIFQGSRPLKKVPGRGIPSSFKWAIHPNDLSPSEIPLEYSLYVENSAGLHKTVTGSVPIEFISTSRKAVEEKPDLVVCKFSLVQFDFDKSEISDADMEIIEKFIIPEIKFNSVIHIYGFTDRIGDDSYNKNLAERRAKAVKDALTSKIKSAKCETYGIGESEMIFDNDLPIGRQLSRTVQIFVETPKQ